MANDRMMVFTGSANPKLGDAVCRYLNIRPGRASVGRFSDGEVSLELMENVRGRDVFILQSTCAPTSDNLMEILVMTDALKRSSAGRITRRSLISAMRGRIAGRAARELRSPPVVADMLETAGVNRVLTMDLHADQIQDSSTSRSTTSTRRRSCSVTCGSRTTTICWWSRPTGRGGPARAIAKRPDSTPAIIDKRRPKANVSEAMNIIGDVDGRTCVIMDDIVDTAEMLRKAAQALKDNGAMKVIAYFTHPVLSGGAVGRLSDSALDELVVTDTIPLSPEGTACKRIRQLSCAQLLAETMQRISNEDSVSSLFTE
jgi:ribose-phosphate pyrophosphokinase